MVSSHQGDWLDIHSKNYSGGSKARGNLTRDVTVKFLVLARDFLCSDWKMEMSTNNHSLILVLSELKRGINPSLILLVLKLYSLCTCQVFQDVGCSNFQVTGLPFTLQKTVNAKHSHERVGD